jgi:hypothetical protein
MVWESATGVALPRSALADGDVADALELLRGIDGRTLSGRGWECIAWQLRRLEEAIHRGDSSGFSTAVDDLEVLICERRAGPGPPVLAPHGILDAAATLVRLMAPPRPDVGGPGRAGRLP